MKPAHRDAPCGSVSAGLAPSRPPRVVVHRAPTGRHRPGETYKHERGYDPVMALEDRIADWLEDGETRARALRVGWWISLTFLVFGYGVIIFTLI